MVQDFSVEGYSFAPQTTKLSATFVVQHTKKKDMPSKQEAAFTTTGFKNWKNAIKHEASTSQLKAVKEHDINQLAMENFLLKGHLKS